MKWGSVLVCSGLLALVNMLPSEFMPLFLSLQNSFPLHIRVKFFVCLNLKEVGERKCAQEQTDQYVNI